MHREISLYTQWNYRSIYHFKTSYQASTFNTTQICSDLITVNPFDSDPQFSDCEGAKHHSEFMTHVIENRYYKVTNSSHCCFAKVQYARYHRLCGWMATLTVSNSKTYQLCFDHSHCMIYTTLEKIFSMKVVPLIVLSKLPQFLSVTEQVLGFIPLFFSLRYKVQILSKSSYFRGQPQNQESIYLF